MTVDFPLERAGGPRHDPDVAQLQAVIAESAELLEAALSSDDAELRDGAVHLALRTLRVMARILERTVPPTQSGGGSVLAGPWAAGVGADADS
ncbi:MAG: hypothetical protein ACREPI_00475 [Candidatus Dormibacterales bacterium]